MGQIGEVKTTRQIAIPDRKPEPLEPQERQETGVPIEPPLLVAIVQGSG